MTIALVQTDLPKAYRPDLEISEENAHKLGKVFWRLVDVWQLSLTDQALLLGVKYHATKLKEWRKKQVIPQDPDKFRRVGHMAGIHKNLRILFPYNRQAVYGFMQQKQASLFNDKTPLDIIREGGPINSYINLAAIRRRLDQIRT